MYKLLKAHENKVHPLKAGDVVHAIGSHYENGVGQADVLDCVDVQGHAHVLSLYDLEVLRGPEFWTDFHERHADSVTLTMTHGVWDKRAYFMIERRSCDPNSTHFEDSQREEQYMPPEKLKMFFRVIMNHLPSLKMDDDGRMWLVATVRPGILYRTTEDVRGYVEGKDGEDIHIIIKKGSHLRPDWMNRDGGVFFTAIDVEYSERYGARPWVGLYPYEWEAVEKVEK